jgi:hypothetical protein
MIGQRRDGREGRPRDVIARRKIAFVGNSVDELNNNDLILKFYLGLSKRFSTPHARA